MLTREALIARSSIEQDFLFFWGHTPKVVGRVDASCLSQWFPCAFEIDGTHYASAEHYMMAEKARLFADAEVLAKILVAKTPAEAKALGREVRNFETKAWERVRGEAVVRGNVAKFAAHQEMKAFLLSTDDKILVEASPRDRIWGIGMGASNPDARIPARWRGSNLLGFALMAARDTLRNR